MSQFDALFKTDAKVKKETKPKAKQTKKSVDASLSASTDKPARKTVAEKRAGGKSSNPDYTQVLSYIRRDTHNQVKAALIFDERKRDLSDLVEELLAAWVKKNSR
jgi:GTP cyclohydrolase FolE2